VLRTLLLGLVTLGCSPRGFVESRPCASEDMAVDQVIVGAVLCLSERFNGEEEARPSDYFMGNNHLRAVIRHPESSPTLTGLGGATLVDLATWDGVDVLHEAVPLVGGSWLDVNTFEVDERGITVGGLTRPLPDRPGTDEGTPTEIRWSIKANDPRIYLEGADGLWLHPKGPARIHKSTIQIGDVILAHNGSATEDLGGAFRIDGATWLLLSDVTTAWAWLDDETQRITGSAPQASHLVLYEGAQPTAELPLREKDFDLQVPETITSLRAVAEGFAPSDAYAPDEGMNIRLGGVGEITLRPVWSGSRSTPLEAHWTDSADREHRAWLSPEGVSLETGEGVFHLEISGPDWVAPSTLTVEVKAEATAEVHFPVSLKYEPPSAQRLVFDALADRSRTHRGSDVEQFEALSSTGAAFTLLLAEDDVPETDFPPPLRPYLSHEHGVITTSPTGWEILSWPWTASFRRAGHGAVDTRFLDPETGLAAAWGGPGTNRFTAVNAAWFQQVTVPAHTLEPRPDFVLLPPPDEDLGATPGWSHWFDWLNQGIYLLPLAESAWVHSPIAPSTTAAELQDALIRGRHVATTGPGIELEVDGVGPGELLKEDEVPPFRDLWIRVVGSPETVDHIVLIGDGEELVHWSVNQLPFEWSGLLKHRPNWLVAVAWSEDTETWAVSAPIWLNSPA
jgi:hypothetical protein